MSARPAFRCLILVGALAGLAACGDDKAPAAFTVKGRVAQGSNAESELSPLGHAEVSASIDKDGNGRFEAGETSTVVADAEGAFSVSPPAEAQSRVLVRISSPDKAPAFRVVKAQVGATLEADVLLPNVEGLGCEADGVCSLANRTLRLSQLSEELVATGRVFNPAVQPEAMPGSLVDRAGQAHRSLALALLLVMDVDGVGVLDLPAPARMCVDVPREGWALLADATPGNARVDVRFHAFDGVSGTWGEPAMGALEGPSGEFVSEADLDAAKAGTRVPGLSACVEVREATYWSLGTESAATSCASGTVVSAEERPVEGASVVVRGVTYAGSAETEVTGGSGNFCARVLTSDTAEQQVRLRILHQGRIYDGGQHVTPNAPAVCGAGCLDLGRVKLEPSRELVPRLCEVRGAAVDAAGAPLAGAVVEGTDDAVSRAGYERLCGEDGEQCTTDALTGADGAFALKLPVVDGLRLSADYFAAQDTGSSTERAGASFTPGCPAGPVTVRLREGTHYYALEVAVAASRISWTPNLSARTLVVTSAAGQEKWRLRAASVGGFVGPVTYGTAPAGSVQVFPATGAPAALAAEDQVEVMVSGTDPDGLYYSGSGTGP